MPAFVLSFESTHAAMASDAAFKAAADRENRPRPSIIPTPKEISAGCGMSLRFICDSDKTALALCLCIDDAKGFAALYRSEGEHYILISHL